MVCTYRWYCQKEAISSTESTCTYGEQVEMRNTASNMITELMAKEEWNSSTICSSAKQSEDFFHPNRFSFSFSLAVAKVPSQDITQMPLVYLPTCIWLRLENVIICWRSSQKLGLKAMIWVSLESVEILAMTSHSEASPPLRSNSWSVLNWSNIMFPTNSSNLGRGVFEPRLADWWALR